jgi:hypothetical protein
MASVLGAVPEQADSQPVGRPHERRQEAVMLDPLTTTTAALDRMRNPGHLAGRSSDDCASRRAAACAGGGFDGHDIDDPLDDWDLLFNAVKNRLRAAAAVRSQLGVSGLALVDAEAERASTILRDEVLECVRALDQLHAMRVRELGCWRRG